VALSTLFNAAAAAAGSCGSSRETLLVTCSLLLLWSTARPVTSCPIGAFSSARSHASLRSQLRYQRPALLHSFHLGKASAGSSSSSQQAVHAPSVSRPTHHPCCARSFLFRAWHALCVLWTFVSLGMDRFGSILPRRHRFLRRHLMLNQLA
jgi:hypothetical protein